MKKQISLCLALALAFSLAACGGTDTSPSGNNGSSNTANAGSQASGAAGPTPEPIAVDTVLRDMSADIANPNLAGKYTANIGGPITEQGDWIYYIAGQSIYRVRKDAMDFAAAELLYQESKAGPIGNLNISGKYMYYFASNKNGDGRNIRQLDLETGEAITLYMNRNYGFSLFYYDGYLYESGMEEGIGGARDTVFVRRITVPAQEGALPEELFAANYNDTSSDFPYILGVNDQGVYMFTRHDGIMRIEDGTTTMIYDPENFAGAIMAGDTIYYGKGLNRCTDVYAFSTMDGSDVPVFLTDFGKNTSFGVTTDGRLILCDDTDVFYADTGEIIAAREINNIQTVSNGGIFFRERYKIDSELFYMDQNGGNFTVIG